MRAGDLAGGEVGPLLVTTCAVCVAVGTVLYRAPARASAAIAQERASGWGRVGELVVCPRYPCHAMASRWRAADIATAAGIREPVGLLGPERALDVYARLEAHQREVPAAAAAPWWVRVAGRLGRVAR